MKRAIVLAGVSGVGKTHTRLNDPELRDLPHLDIADVYRQFPELDWMEAFWALVKRASRWGKVVRKRPVRFAVFCLRRCRIPGV